MKNLFYGLIVLAIFGAILALFIAFPWLFGILFIALLLK